MIWAKESVFYCIQDTLVSVSECVSVMWNDCFNFGANNFAKYQSNFRSFSAWLNRKAERERERERVKITVVVEKTFLSKRTLAIFIFVCRYYFGEMHFLSFGDTHIQTHIPIYTTRRRFPLAKWPYNKVWCCCCFWKAVVRMRNEKRN